MREPLRIALVAPPLEPVPPPAYGGTERIVHELATNLFMRGHDVTTFAPGDSRLPGRHIETVQRALWAIGDRRDPSPHFLRTICLVLQHARLFDVIHSHIEWYGVLLAELLRDVPVVLTLHGRIDHSWAADLLARTPGALVALSDNQASFQPRHRWNVIYNGLTFPPTAPNVRRTEALCFIGRATPDKGVVEAIAIAQAAGRTLRIALKAPTTGPESSYHEEVVMPAVAAAGSTVEYLGELDGRQRDALLAESYATLMPGGWPEPFGLVAIESLACETPVLARRAGALPEVVRDGIDGFLADESAGLVGLIDRVAELDRKEIANSVRLRFSARGMTDAYETLYRRITDQL